MVFITAGMGGGTGTGGAPVIAQIAKDSGALTVGVVTKPFNFEGKRRRRHAELGIQKLKEHVDTLIVIPNEKLISMARPDLSMIDAFKMADGILVDAVKGITELINVEGTINLDFADVRAIMSGMGHALMGIGIASGPDRAREAALKAISSPLLEDVDIEGATGVLINVTAGSNIGILELHQAVSVIQEAAHEDANIICGTVIDESIQDQVRVTVIATGFPMDFEASMAQTKRPSWRAPAAISKEKNVSQQRHEGAPSIVQQELPALDSNLPTAKGFDLHTVDSSMSRKEQQELTAITLGEKDQQEVPYLGQSDDEVSIEIDDAFLTSEIDRTIDQAIRLTSEMNQVEERDEIDEMHVPAFLRSFSKEISN
jgi:cell division protein FtsZ